MFSVNYRYFFRLVSSFMADSRWKPFRGFKAYLSWDLVGNGSQVSKKSRGWWLGTVGFSHYLRVLPWGQPLCSNGIISLHQLWFLYYIYIFFYIPVSTYYISCQNQNFVFLETSDLVCVPESICFQLERVTCSDFRTQIVSSWLFEKHAIFLC